MSAAETTADRPGALRARLATGLAGDLLGTVGINVGQMVLGFAATVTLTRLLGAEGFGAYSFAFAWATVLSVPSVVGLTPLVVRHVATYRERAAWGHIRGIIRVSSWVVAATSLVVAGTAAAIAWLVMDPGTELRGPFLTGMLLVPLIALTTMRQAAIQGLGRVVLGRIPETVIAPGLLLALLLAAAAASGGDYSATVAVALQVISTAVAFGLGAWLLLRILPSKARSAPPSYESAIWLRGGLALLAASIALALNSQLGTILLGVLQGSQEAGLFSAASRFALFAGFLYLAATYPLMPALARLHATGATAELERLAVRATRAIVLASLPLLVVLVVFAPQVLAVFGGGFDAGASTMRILLAGEAVKILTGFGGIVMIMAARERTFARVMVAATGLNLAASLFLIPLLGTDGAALSMAVSVAVMNVALLVMARRELGLWTAAIALPGSRRGDSAGR